MTSEDETGRDPEVTDDFGERGKDVGSDDVAEEDRFADRRCEATLEGSREARGTRAREGTNEREGEVSSRLLPSLASGQDDGRLTERKPSSPASTIPRKASRRLLRLPVL